MDLSQWTMCVMHMNFSIALEVQKKKNPFIFFWLRMDSESPSKYSGRGPRSRSSFPGVCQALQTHSVYRGARPPALIHVVTTLGAACPSLLRAGRPHRCTSFSPGRQHGSYSQAEERSVWPWQHACTHVPLQVPSPPGTACSLLLRESSNQRTTHSPPGIKPLHTQTHSKRPLWVPRGILDTATQRPDL